jgi:CHASE2 domain-containing sensor protein
LTLIYGNAPVFKKLETLAGDFIMLAREPEGDSDVAIVRITDDDYKQCFGGKSPLDPVQVHQIIGVIAAGKPKVIGVALDTSTPSFQSLRPPPDWPPIVWARDAFYSDVHEKYLLSGALGEKTPEVSYGLVALKPDSDGVIRRYSRWYDTDAGPKPAPSLPWAMLQKFRNDQSSPSDPDFKEQFLINYGGRPMSQHFLMAPISTIRGMCGNNEVEANDSGAKSEQAGLPKRSTFENKMVILGGDYKAEDEHNTPVGTMIGSEVLAWILETEQQGGGRKPVGKVAIALLAIFDSIVLLSLIHLFGLGKTLLMSTILIPTLAVLLSLLLFGSVHYAGTLLVILLAVLSYEVYEKGKGYYKKWREKTAEQLR